MKKIGYNTIYYWISSFYLFSILLGTGNIEKLFFGDIGTFQAVSRYVVLLNLIVLFLMKNNTIRIKPLLSMIIVIIIIGLSYFRIDDAIMMLTILFVFCGKGIDLQKLSKYIYKTVAVTTILFVVLCFLGISPDIYVVRSGSERMGHSLGFIGSNACASTVFIGLIYYFYANRKVWTKKNYCVYICIMILTYVITKSRMTFMLEILMLFLLGIIHKLKNTRVIYVLQGWSYLFCSLISVVLTVWYGKNPYGYIQNILNLFTTGRLYWCHYFLKEYGVSLFGQNVNLIGSKAAALTGTNWQSIDNAYIMLAIHYGIAVLIVFCISCILLGKYLKRKNNIEGAICVLILAIWGLTENSIIVIGYNIAFYLFAEMLWNGGLKVKKEIMGYEK